MASLVDTDIKNNIGHIRPYLGIMLIGSIALGFGMILYNAATELAQAVQPNASKYIEKEGDLVLQTKGTIQYGDTIAYKASSVGGRPGTANTYITTVCFQENEMVYQVSTEKDESVYLYDQKGGNVTWDGKKASCSASLMYREVSEKTTTLSLVDSLSFNVEERGY